MKNILSFFIAAVIILSISSAIIIFEKLTSKKHFSGFQHKDFILPFEIMNPDSIYILPKELKEISGLSHYREQIFFTVNDEEGILYLYDIAQNQIASEIDFGKDGDYEALTTHNDLVYIAESNGNIKVVDYQRRIKIKEYNTSLSKKNDIEGICYNAENNTLLIACKGDLEKTTKNKNLKGIYAFDLSTEDTEVKPFKIINLRNEIDSLRRINLIDNIINKTNSNSRINRFAPSGLSYDPITGYLYILSHRGNLLIVADKKKEIIGIYFLSHRIFGQPEGISFDEVGNLYISNESKSTKANIIQFNRTEKEMKTLKEVLDSSIGTKKNTSTRLTDSLEMQ